jgi:mannosyltransferase OCH1-like enzyme
MQVSQIFLSSNPGVPLSPAMQQATQSVRNCFPHLEYKLYDEEDIQKLLTDNFQDSVLECYNKLNSYAFKADLARYCILYVHGGWYFDATIRCLKGIQLPHEINVLGFRDTNRYIGTTNAADNSVIYAGKPMQTVFLDAINACVDNISNNYYGWNPLCVTGPIVWGDVVTDNFHPQHYFFGDVLELTPGHPDKNKALVLPDGAILALKKKAAGGDLSVLGAIGTNNYNELWQSRTLYK